jgi:hypothetical protein
MKFIQQTDLDKDGAIELLQSVYILDKDKIYERVYGGLMEFDNRTKIL